MEGRGALGSGGGGSRGGALDCLELLGISWGCVGVSWGLCGGFLKPFESLLGDALTPLAALWGSLGGISGPREAFLWPRNQRSQHMKNRHIVLEEESFFQGPADGRILWRLSWVRLGVLSGAKYRRQGRANMASRCSQRPQDDCQMLRVGVTRRQSSP